MAEEYDYGLVSDLLTKMVERNESLNGVNHWKNYFKYILERETQPTEYINLLDLYSKHMQNSSYWRTAKVYRR